MAEQAMRETGSQAAGCRGRRGRARCFTLIEVILGLGVLAFGVISLLALFPVSLQASRDSLAETYAAESADQFVSFLSAHLRSPDEDYQVWRELGQGFPTSKPGSTEPSDGWQQWFSEDTSTFSMGGGSNEFHRIERRTTGLTGTDFSAICRVWREPVVVTRYDGGSWDTVTLSSSEALGLNVEISWPTEVPYIRRHKALYHLEVFRE